MHIVVDARFVGPQQTGLGRYTEELLKSLEKIDHQNRYTVLLRREARDYYRPSARNFTTAEADFQWYTFGEQIGMLKVLRRLKPDLVHFCHFNVPIAYRRPFVVTIHDLIKDEFKGQESTTRSRLVYALKHRAYSWVSRHAILRSRYILTPSEASRQKILKHYRVPADKVMVTHEAADRRFARYRTLQVTEDQREQLAQKYHLKFPFLLYVGNAYPYKNLDRLLSALKLLPTPINLVNPCARSIFYDRLAQVARQEGLSDRVILPGFVPDTDLAKLYRLAVAYVFPSLSEGFGLPLLEAQMAGLPVVASSAPPLPEVGGNGAIYFNPHDIADMARQIERLVQDVKLRQQLMARGIANAQRFDWDRTARQTLEVYQRCKHEPAA